MGQIGKSKQKQNGEKIQMCEKWKNGKIAKTENWRKKLKKETKKIKIQKSKFNQLN